MIGLHDAEDIAEELLHCTGTAMMSGDIDAFLKRVSLPFLVETADNRGLLETGNDIEAMIVGLRDYMSTNAVTENVRTVVSANYIDHNTIGSTHVTQMVRANGELFRKPFPAYSILRKTHGVWRVASSCYAILDSPEHNEILCIGRRSRSIS